MSSVLQQQVIVLNRVWQAIGSRLVQDALSQMAAGAATGLDITGEDSIRPVTWEEWITLPIREGDGVIHTSKLQIRVPTVIASVVYAGFPKKRPKFNLRGVAQRDGNRCQYSGRLLSRAEMSIDHVIPRSRGGRDHWTNGVLADKAINQRKGNQFNHEAGLKLLRVPVEPPVTPVIVGLVATHPHHKLFLKA